MVWRSNKGSSDPNSPDWGLDPLQDPGHTHQTGVVGSATGATAAVTSPSFISTTALQLNATQDVVLYIQVKTAASLGIKMGPTLGTENIVCAAESEALGLITIRVPSSWLVQITGTIADLGIIAVTY
jgi:hypothetical protein